LYNINNSRLPPTSSVALTYSPSTQACSPQSTCSDPRYPYSVLPDGSSGFACSGGQTCRCVKDVRCPYYISSYFQEDATGGILNGYYKQMTSYIDADGKVSSIPPLNMGITNPLNQCLINDVQLAVPTPENLYAKFLMYPSFCVSGTFIRVDASDGSNGSLYGCGNTTKCSDKTQIPVVQRDIFGNTVTNSDGGIFTCKANSDPNVAFVLQNQP
jgi:hypothetical protein